MQALVSYITLGQCPPRHVLCFRYKAIFLSCKCHVWLCSLSAICSLQKALVSIGCGIDFIEKLVTDLYLQLSLHATRSSGKRHYNVSLATHKQLLLKELSHRHCYLRLTHPLFLRALLSESLTGRIKSHSTCINLVSFSHLIWYCQSLIGFQIN